MPGYSYGNVTGLENPHLRRLANGLQLSCVIAEKCGSAFLPHVAGQHPRFGGAEVDSGRPVQAIAIAYYGDDGRRSAAAAFVDSMNLLQSIGAVLRCGSITARLVIAPPLAPAGRTRKQLAREAHGLVVTLLARPLRESDIHKICA